MEGERERGELSRPCPGAPLPAKKGRGAPASATHPSVFLMILRQGLGSGDL